MKCYSVIKHNLKVYTKKCNLPQGQFMDLIISLFIVIEIYLIVHKNS